MQKSYSIVIVGGGAGGLELAVDLTHAGHDDLLLVDRNTTHVWKPRLHELAAGLGRGQIDEVPYTTLANQWGFDFQQGELDDVSPANKTLTLAPLKNSVGDTVVPERTLAYHALVLAVGGVTPDRGVDGVLTHAAMLNDVVDAEALFARLSQGLLAHAVQATGRPFEIVVVGSGATGVELSAHLTQDYLCNTLAPALALPEIRVTMLEASDNILSGVEDAVRETLQRRLTDLGVRIETGKQVSQVSANEVVTNDGNRYPSDLTIWTTGTVGPAVAANTRALATNKKRQWIVKPSLQSTASAAIFALGDCCAMEGDPAPTTAQAASQQAAHLAENVPRYLQGEAPANFEFKNKGTLLSLGDAGGIGNIKRYFGDDIMIKGHLARAAYQGLYRHHQYKILGVVKGTEEVVADLFERAIGPRLKVHG